MRSKHLHPGLVLGFPFVIHLIATLTSWIWQVTGAPGLAGGLSPIAITLLVLLSLGGFYAAQRRLPLGLFTWLPAGLGAIVNLLVALVAREPSGPAQTTALLVFLLVFCFVLVVSVSLARHRFEYGIAFGALFLMTQAIRVPIFEVEALATLTGASLLTLIAFLRATLETGLLIWLVYRLLLKPGVSSAQCGLLLWILVLSHGLFSAWQEPLLHAQAIGFKAFTEAAGQWIISNSLLLGLITVLSRYRYHWAQESAALRTTQPTNENRARKPADSNERFSTTQLPLALGKSKTEPNKASQVNPKSSRWRHRKR